MFGVFGRKAGTEPGYAYSEAMKNSAHIWDEATLDKYLTDPRTFVPGTKMTFAGLKAEKDRIDLIAFLKVETGYKAP